MNPPLDRASHGNTRRPHNDHDQQALRGSLRPIDRTDWDLLNFAITWLPYGRPPEDELMINFGLDMSRYYTRLTAIVETLRVHLPTTTAARLLNTRPVRHPTLDDSVADATARPSNA
jgi:hypothetical protein